MAARTTKKSPFDDEIDEPGQDTMPGGDEAQTEIGGYDVTLKTQDANHATMIIKGKGYDGSSVSVRGNSIPDLKAQIKEHWADLTDVVTAAAELGKTFSDLSGPSDSPKAAASNSGANTGTSETPAWVGACSHGPRKHQSGVKNGKAWEAGFCPGGDDDCKPVWKPKR
jgi:hypothetical protein